MHTHRQTPTGTVLLGAINTLFCQLMIFFLPSVVLGGPGGPGDPGGQSKEEEEGTGGESLSGRLLDYIVGSFTEGAQGEGTRTASRKRKRASSEKPKCDPYLLVPQVLPSLLARLQAPQQAWVLECFTEYHHSIPVTSTTAKLACYGLIGKLLQAPDARRWLFTEWGRSWVTSLPSDLVLAADQYAETGSLSAVLL
jgi:hypothetical protein